MTEWLQKIIKEYFPDCYGRIAVIDYAANNEAIKDKLSTFYKDMKELLKRIVEPENIKKIFVSGRDMTEIASYMKGKGIYKLAENTKRYEYATNSFLSYICKLFKPDDLIFRDRHIDLKEIPKIFRNIPYGKLDIILTKASSVFYKELMKTNIREQLDVEIDMMSIKKLVEDMLNITKIKKQNPICVHNGELNKAIILCNQKESPVSWDMKNLFSRYIRERRYPKIEATYNYSQEYISLHELFHALCRISNLELNNNEEVSYAHECGADSFACLAHAVMYGANEEWEEHYKALSDFRLFHAFAYDEDKDSSDKIYKLQTHFTTPAILKAMEVGRNPENIGTVADAFNLAVKIGKEYNPYKNDKSYKQESPKWYEIMLKRKAQLKEQCEVTAIC